MAAQRIALAKPPTAVVLSHDGQTLYVGLEGRFGGDGGIAVYRRNGETFAEVSELPVAEGVTSLAVTSDERTVVASTPIGLVAVDAGALERGNPATTTVRDGDAPGTNQLVISADNRYVFYTNSRNADLGVARLTPAAGSTVAPAVTIAGHVPLDRVPGGLALSHDGSLLFVTSEIDNVDPTTVTGADDPRLSRARCDVNLGPSGVLTVVSVKTALAAPQHAVLARTAAGCAPVRVALGPGNAVVWVSDRGESRVLAFDVGRLRRGKSALLASVGVGNYPIGVAVSSDGTSVLVANSNHTGQSERDTEGTLSLIDVAKTLGDAPGTPGTLRAGARPREVVASGEGTYLVTNYDGHSIDVVTTKAIGAALPAP